MLKNASELRKLAETSPAGKADSIFATVKQVWGKVNELMDNASFLSTDADKFFKDVPTWSEEEFNNFKRKQNIQKLNPISYQDFNSMARAWGDPGRHSMFFGNVQAGSGKSVLEAFNAMGANGSTYRPGLATYAYTNAPKLDHLKTFADSPVSTATFGDYDKMYNTMMMMDRYGMQGTDENKFLKGYITPEQYKSYQRWRPLMAIWMNIRGWLRSLFQGGNFNAISVSHPYQQNPAPASAGA